VCGRRVGPAPNGHAVALLGDHGVLPASLARSLRQAVGFRNVLVHAYVEVDDSVVLRQLAELGDLEVFLSAVADWLHYLDGR
jgi:uncharacterized protein YutE (UPF0331/DUF86 family)